MFNRGGGEIPVPGNDSFTKALLHMNGLDGGTTFTDDNAGGVSATWSAIGGTTSTSLPKFGSAALQGPGYIQAGFNSAYAAGSGDFTVDLWVNALGNAPPSGDPFYLAGYSSGSLTQQAWYIQVGHTGTVTGFVEVTGGLSASATYAASPILTSGWHHVAFVRSGSTLTVYIDGVAGGTTGTTAAALLNNSSYLLTVGHRRTPVDVPSFRFPGQIDEFRYSVGIARWTANFTPPTGPYS